MALVGKVVIISPTGSELDRKPLLGGRGKRAAALTTEDILRFPSMPESSQVHLLTQHGLDQGSSESE